MRKTILLITSILFGYFTYTLSQDFECTYDAAGNLIIRQVVQLKSFSIEDLVDKRGVLTVTKPMNYNKTRNSLQHLSFDVRYSKFLNREMNNAYRM